MNRSAKEGKHVKCFEQRSNGLDTALYKKKLPLPFTFTISNYTDLNRSSEFMGIN